MESKRTGETKEKIKDITEKSFRIIKERQRNKKKTMSTLEKAFLKREKRLRMDNEK